MKTLEEREIGFYYPYTLADDLAGYEVVCASDHHEAWAFKCEVLHMTEFPSCEELETLFRKHISSTKNYDKLTDLKISEPIVSGGYIRYEVEYTFDGEVKEDNMDFCLY